MMHERLSLHAPTLQRFRYERTLHARITLHGSAPHEAPRLHVGGDDVADGAGAEFLERQRIGAHGVAEGAGKPAVEGLVLGIDDDSLEVALAEEAGEEQDVEMTEDDDDDDWILLGDTDDEEGGGDGDDDKRRVDEIKDEDDSEEDEDEDEGVLEC